MPHTLFGFEKNTDLQSWYLINDGVMGGRSESTFSRNEAGYGVFSGQVSLENNGGFASVRYRLPTLEVQDYTHLLIKLRGDGKRYQLRAKSSVYDRHSYVQYFETTGDWQTIRFTLRDLYPVFRGRRLSMPDYPGAELQEVGFLIGNKKAETFRLELEKAWLE